jgi:acetolactate synthase I/II/III large subunit
MNGAESLIATLAAAGVDTCFANPGTSEMHLVAALDKQSQIRSILCLFEGAATAAADGYARMSGKPGCTLLHLGPGIANGLANLHNARRARSSIVNLIGQHAFSHLTRDTPLRSDIEAIARPYSDWLRTSKSALEAGKDSADAVLAACTPPGHIASLIVPANVAWESGGEPGAVPKSLPAPLPKREKIENAARVLRSNLPAALLLSGNTLQGKGLESAGRISSATGAKLFVPYPFSRLERGVGRPNVQRIPYAPQQAKEFLKNIRHLILVGAIEPLAYFASPTRSATLIPSECEIHELASPNEDCAGALDAIEIELDLKKTSHRPTSETGRASIPTGSISLEGLAATIAATLQERTIVVDESMTAGRGIMAAATNAPPHDWLANTGGSIGIAMPLAVGAAAACRHCPVLCLSADGSGMYTLQALWTMARESLRITTVIFANRSYEVLKREFASLGIGAPGQAARNLFEIDRPELDWVALAKGMGVPSVRIHSLEELAKALMHGYASQGPSLIEVVLAPNS